MAKNIVLALVCVAFGRDVRREVAALPVDQLQVWGLAAEAELARQSGNEACEKRLDHEIEMLIMETRDADKRMGL